MEYFPGAVSDIRDQFEKAVLTEIMPIIVSLGLGEYWLRSRDLIDAEKLSREILANRQWQAFRSMLAHAYQSVPLYRSILQDASVSPDDIANHMDLAKLPTINKQMIVSGFPDRVTSTASRREEWRYRSTSGTTSQIMSVTDYSARQWRYALYLRSLHIAAGYEVGMSQVSMQTRDCMEVCATDSPSEYGDIRRSPLPVELEWPPFGFASLSMQETRLPPLTGRGTLIDSNVLDDYLHRIGDLEPYLVRGLPMYLLLLARRLQETGVKPPVIQRIVVQGALAPRAIKEEISRTFGSEVREIYGSAELGGIAAECEAGSLHLASDAFLLEVLRTDGTVSPTGEAGFLVVTSMTNRAMPLIRYKIGDVGRLLEGECQCGRKTPCLVVDGRVAESILGPHGLITTRQIADTVLGIPGVAFFQLAQRQGAQVDLSVVPSSIEPPNYALLGARVEELLGGYYRVNVRTAQAIWPEESGKFVYVKPAAKG